MTEDQIERIVCHRTNGIDARFMRGGLTQAEYDAEMKALSRWADKELAAMTRAERGEG